MEDEEEKIYLLVSYAAGTKMHNCLSLYSLTNSILNPCLLPFYLFLFQPDLPGLIHCAAEDPNYGFSISLERNLIYYQSRVCPWSIDVITLRRTGTNWAASIEYRHGYPSNHTRSSLPCLHTFSNAASIYTSTCFISCLTLIVNIRIYFYNPLNIMDNLYRNPLAVDFLLLS